MNGITTRLEKYIVDSEGNRVGVVLDMGTYQHLLEAAAVLASLQANNTTNQNVTTVKLDSFVGMWADFTEQEDREFRKIYEERGNYFTRDELDP